MFAGSLLAGSLFAQQRELSFESAGDFLKPAGRHCISVKWPAWPRPPRATLLVYFQGGGPNATIGAARIHINGGPRLIEFDRTGKFQREIGGSDPNNRPYDFLFAQGVRVDPQDNIWVVDRASRMVVKFDQSGRVLLTLGPQARGGR